MIEQRANGATVFICGRKPLKKCAYCENEGTQLCDYGLVSGGTCDEPLCKLHAWTPKIGEDYCRTHRRIIEAPMRVEKAKAERELKKRDTLIFIARSKYSGFCREKDCGAQWDQGEGMFWDSKTKEVFCSECGELMQ